MGKGYEGVDKLQTIVIIENMELLNGTKNDLFIVEKVKIVKFTRNFVCLNLEQEVLKSRIWVEINRIFLPLSNLRIHNCIVNIRFQKEGENRFYPPPC